MLHAEYTSKEIRIYKHISLVSQPFSTNCFFRLCEKENSRIALAWRVSRRSLTMLHRVPAIFRDTRTPGWKRYANDLDAWIDHSRSGCRMFRTIHRLILASVHGACNGAHSYFDHISVRIAGTSPPLSCPLFASFSFGWSLLFETKLWQYLNENENPLRRNRELTTNDVSSLLNGSVEQLVR